MSTESQALTREAITRSDDRKPERVELPEWKGHAFVRVLSLEERAELETRRDGASAADVAASIVAFALCDASGERLFKTDEAIAELKQKSGLVLMRLAARVSRMNGLTRKDMEEIAKNSEAALSDASSSSLPNG